VGINALNRLNGLFPNFFYGFKNNGLKKVTEEPTTDVTLAKNSTINK